MRMGDGGMLRRLDGSSDSNVAVGMYFVYLN